MSGASLADNFSYLSILNPGFTTVSNTGPVAAGTFGYVSFLNPPAQGSGGTTIVQGGSINGSTGDISIVGGSNVTVSNNASTVEIVAAGSRELVAGSNITLSTDASNITIVGASGGTGGGGGAAISAGTSSQSTGTVAFIDSNGIVYGLSNGSLTAGLQRRATVFAGAGGSTAADSTWFWDTGQASQMSFIAFTNMRLNFVGGILGFECLAAGTLSTGATGASITANTGGISVNVPLTYLSAGANITLSTTSNTVAIIGPTPGAGGGVAIAYSNVTQTSGTLVLSGSNGISVRSGANTAIIEFDGHHMDAVIPSGNGFGTGFSSMTSGTLGLVAGSNVSFSQNGNKLTIQAATNALTTAAQVSHSHAFATTTTGGASIVVGTSNSAGVTIGVPAYLTTAQSPGAYLTTAAQVSHSHAFATTTTNGSVINVATSGSAGVTIAVPPFITAAGAGGGATVNGSTGDVSIVAGANITLSTAGSTITVIGPSPGGGAAATVGGLELWPPIGGGTVFSTGGLGTIYFQKFIPAANVSFNNFERRYSGSTVSSAISAQAAHSITYGLYLRGAGASTSIYNLIASSSILYRASYSSNLSAGLTVSQGAGSYTASSNGTVVQSQLTGFKHAYLPFTTTITAGGEYAYAQVMSSATTGATGPLRIGFQELSVINNLTIGRISPASITATAASNLGDWAQGVYSSSSNGLPATLAISGLTNAVSQQRMYLQMDA